MVLSLNIIFGAIGLSMAMLVGVAIYGSVPEQSNEVEVENITDCVNCNDENGSIYAIIILLPFIILPIVIVFSGINGTSITKIFDGFGGKSTTVLEEPRREDGWQGASDFE